FYCSGAMLYLHRWNITSMRCGNRGARGKPAGSRGGDPAEGESTRSFTDAGVTSTTWGWRLPAEIMQLHQAAGEASGAGQGQSLLRAAILEQPRAGTYQHRYHGDDHFIHGIMMQQRIDHLRSTVTIDLSARLPA